MAEEQKNTELEAPIPELKQEKEMGSLIDSLDGFLSEGDPPPVKSEPVFQDITSAEQFPPLLNFPVELALFCLIGLILLGLLLYFLIKKKTPTKTAVNYYLEALRELPSIKDKLSTQPLGQSASELSLHLREALKKATNSPALFQTQKEFLSSDALMIENQSLSTEATGHLNELWSLEYASPTHDPERAASLYSTTETLLKKLSRS